MLGLLALTGCGEKVADTGCALHDPPLTWNNFGAGFLAENCNGCHHSMLPEAERSGAPLGVDFDTPEGAGTWRDEIEARATPDDATMPPSGPLSEEDRMLLSELLRCEF